MHQRPERVGRTMTHNKGAPVHLNRLQELNPAALEMKQMVEASIGLSVYVICMPICISIYLYMIYLHFCLSHRHQGAGPHCPLDETDSQGFHRIRSMRKQIYLYRANSRARSREIFAFLSVTVALFGNVRDPKIAYVCRGSRI